MRPALRDVPSTKQGNAHNAMPDHERDYRPLLLGERKELRCKLTHHVAVERDPVRDPESIEDRKQCQRVFQRLSERFGSFDQQTCPLRSRLSFRRRKPFDMDEWGYERDLKLDLLTTQGWRARQGLNLTEGMRELLYGFNHRRARQRSLSRCAPQRRSFLDQARLGAVTRQQFRLGFGD